MYSVFTVNSSNDWILPTKSNLINFSVLKEVSGGAPFRSFSVKYVCRGHERYVVNGNKYSINSGEYLLANHFAEGVVEIDKEVTGICIDVAPDLLSEVVASVRRPDSLVADIALDTFFNTSLFLENRYRSSETAVGRFMSVLDAQITNEPKRLYSFSREFYYTLAEKIVEDHVPVFKQLQAVKAVRSLTRKDLYRRIAKGKEFIEQNFSRPMQVEEVARDCGISEYHFFRLFKSVFGISPHQYLLKCRLGFAAQLMRSSGASVSDAALLSGFSDVYSFSKTFKKHFGVSPSLIIKI